MARILLVGLEPESVDFSDPSLPPGLTAAHIRAGIASVLEEFKARGWPCVSCLITPEPEGIAVLEAALREAGYDCVVIGGGIRLPPSRRELFETVVNVVHEGAPGAKIAFNTRPEDSLQAAMRQLGAK